MQLSPQQSHSITHLLGTREIKTFSTCLALLVTNLHQVHHLKTFRELDTNTKKTRHLQQLLSSPENVKLFST